MFIFIVFGLFLSLNEYAISEAVNSNNLNEGLGSSESMIINEDNTVENENKLQSICPKCNCGERNEIPRIVGGSEADVNEFPWMVRLSYFRKFYCAGMIITDRHVITAAHCVKGLLWSTIKLTLGVHNSCNVSKSPETRYITRIIMKNFTFSDFNNDIAILVMNRRINFTDAIKPVCLPANDAKSYTGEQATAAGWGSTSERSNASCKLQEINLPVLSIHECRNKTNYTPDMISDTMLCAGYNKLGKKDTCQGDSGGPLVFEKKNKRYEVIGIVSWGIGCARPGYPGVYTRITKYLKWVRENTDTGCYCKQ